MGLSFSHCGASWAYSGFGLIPKLPDEYSRNAKMNCANNGGTHEIPQSQMDGHSTPNNA